MFTMMLFKAFAQPTTAPTTPPSRSASDVLSLFSGAYTDYEGTDWYPNWGQSTQILDTTIAGNAVKNYSSLNYQGVDIFGAVNVANMQNLHLDIWTSNCTAFEVVLINEGIGEQGFTINPTADGWYSVDIALSNYTNVNLGNIGQIKLVGTPFGTSNVYLDNIYFWKESNTPTLSNFSIPAKVLGDAAFSITAPTSNSSGAFTYTSSNTAVATVSGSTITLVGLGTTNIIATQAAAGGFGSGTISASLVVTSPPPATAAPNPPTRSAANVVSLFSDAYSNVSVDTWSTVWDNTVEPQDVSIAGNTTKLYNNLVFAGIEFISSPINATNMEKFHIDIWTPDATVFKIKFVDLGPNGVFGGGDDVEQELGYTPAQSTWVSYDINMSDFTALVTRGHIGQMIFVAEGGTVYMDNIYFWRANPVPTFGSFTVPAKTVGAAAFTLTAPTSNSAGAFTFTSSNTNVATISGTTVTVVGAGTSVISATQAAAGSFGSGSTTANLVVTGPSAPTSAAPNPPTRVATDVISVFSGAYSNLAGTDFFPNWGQNAFAVDTTIAGNLTRIYPNLNYHGIQLASSIDASGMTNLHFDIWTANCETFDLYLINPAIGFERKISFNPPFAGWQSYDVALSQYSAQGVDLSSIGQFKLVSTPFGGTTVYIDNMYFWKPAGAPSYGSFTIPTKTVGDAKFKITPPTSTSSVAFTYTSSNTSVATISNDSIIVVGAGTSTITANQAAGAGFLAGLKTAVLTVDFATPTVAAPVPPTRNAADVKSLFSNAYSNETVDTWSTVWDVTSQSDIQIQGNATKKYFNHLFSGIEFTSAPIDASEMTSFHLDIYTPDANVFRIKFVDFGADASFGGGDDSESELTFTPTKGGWVSIDIPASNFSGLASRGHLAQMIFSTAEEGNALRTMYLDNIYFYKGSALSPSINVTQPSCTVTTGSISIVSPINGYQYSKDNGVTFSNTTSFTALAVGTYKIRSKSPNNVISDSVMATIISTTPTAPGTITGNINISQCDTLQTYSVVNTDGYTYNWTVTGTGNSVKSGQGANSAVLVMKTTGIVTVKAAKCGTTYGPSSTLSVSGVQPAAPTTFTGTGTNVCLFTQTYVAATGVKDTFRVRRAPGVTGYYFDAPAGSTVVRLNDTTITVVFADTITLTSPKSVNAYYLSSCDTSLAKSIALTRTVVAAPTAVTITPLQTNICGARKYRYSAPALPAGALGYVWSFQGSLYSGSGTIDSGTVNSRVLTVTYTSNAASAAGDSVKLLYTTGCGNSVAKAAKLSNTALAVPATPTAITITPLITNQCNNRVYRYSAPNLPVASTTAGAATGWLWELTGSMSEFATIDSGDESSQKMVVSFTSNAAAAAGDSIKLTYLSLCGNSKTKASKLSNTKLSVPATPTAITITALQTNVCGARKYRYAAPALPSASTTAGAATGYVWSFVGSLSSTVTVDSGSLTSRVFTATFTSNAASATGDSVRVLYTSDCGNSLRKASKLSNTALGVPLAPTAITITALQTNVCGARKYRYTAPALPSASTTAGAATGYVWSFVGSLSSTVTVDSGSLTSRSFTATFTSNAASATGDSVRVLYTSDCGNSLRKASKLSNAALGTPLAPATVTIQQVLPDVCGARVYRYIAPALPSATTTAGAASGYLWTSPTGTVGSTGVLDSGLTSGRIIRYRYSSNAAATTDSIRVRYTSGCGNGAIKAQKLSNLVKVCLTNGTEITSRIAPTSVETATLNVYPNPNNGNFIISAKTSVTAKSYATIQIIDMLGKVVAQVNAQNNNGTINTNINNSNLKNGVYIVRIMIGNDIRTVKMVVKK